MVRTEVRGETYAILTDSFDFKNLVKRLDELRREGWKPIMMAGPFAVEQVAVLLERQK
jgi:hypothetical protein